ncbi:RES family NAD+ phosphorylase [Bradyrhizobium sp. 193]|uniref:RES family NAD+ phosphorylase n=1 Tax=Bradyrhizobium sp. 193 TaxID=2782661 RepID=UPI003211B2EB|nr:RES family NAD+ phosphorylase [Bradyrhizobium sp. 193]MCK1707509.1 RES family NAD+ phosphorylase [Bradyrhizobium sp. 146]
MDEHKPRDIALLDALDSLPRTALRARAWRTVKEGRDPLEGGRSRGRWGHDGMETWYASHEEDGSVAEIHSMLSAQPVFPSKLRWLNHELEVELNDVMSLPTLPRLAALGVDVARYQAREYARTQDIADAALFLGFKALVVPSARWECTNLVVFTERTDPGQLAVIGAPKFVDWTVWRERRAAARGRTESGS